AQSPASTHRSQSGARAETAHSKARAAPATPERTACVAFKARRLDTAAIRREPPGSAASPASLGPERSTARHLPPRPPHRLARRKADRPHRGLIRSPARESAKLMVFAIPALPVRAV